MKIKTLGELKAVQQRSFKKLFPDKPRIAVGLATCGIAAGGDEVYTAIQNALKEKNVDAFLTKTGCFGICHEEPLVNVRIPGKPLVILHKIKKEDANLIVSKVARMEVPEGKALCKIEEWDHLTLDKPVEYGKGYSDIPLWNETSYFKPQKKVVLRDAGIINPEDIDEYITVGGYFTLYKALTEMTPDEVIEELKKSGLRGRGGAGFPTGKKWEFTKKEKSPIKYVICNAAEGEPGTFKDRVIMEGDPHMIIEGMLIGAYAIGVEEGYIYVKAEYPLAIERLKKAINDAKKYGLLGENIFGTNFSFDIKLATGAGAFVCGEETAIIASIEGKLCRPHPRPPFPAQKGLWDKPTNINNVETWCNIMPIIKKGGEWFSKIGTKENSGTKVFSLVGKINKAGSVEVPLGTPINTIVYDIGEGGTKGKKIKAVQTGGPSGGCIPTRLFDTPMDYDHVKEVGSIMGSGGIVVMDEDTCMVDTAKHFLNFTSDESCGKCVPCREGLKRMYDILDKITSGKGEMDDLETLKELSSTIKETSLCGLGQTAPSPVITTIQYFEDEYLAHIKEKRCPAKVCKALTNYYIVPDKCTGCTICAKNCPAGAIDGKPGYIHIIDQEKCIKSGTCMDVCPFDAVIKLSGEKIETPLNPIPVKKRVENEKFRTY